MSELIAAVGLVVVWATLARCRRAALARRRRDQMRYLIGAERWWGRK